MVTPQHYCALTCASFFFCKKEVSVQLLVQILSAAHNVLHSYLSASSNAVHIDKVTNLVD
jgi:hypothetical protein